jgi:hypothetical protein
MAAIANDITLWSWAGEAAGTWAAVTAISAAMEAASRRAFLKQQLGALTRMSHSAATTSGVGPSSRRGCKVE